MIEPCILAGCPVGGVVLDPFSGSGTTGAVACYRGREYIGIELNPEYVEQSRQRIENYANEVKLVKKKEGQIPKDVPSPFDSFPEE